MTRVGRRNIAATVLVIGLTATACGIPTGGGPTAIARSNVPFHLLDPATTTTTGPGPPPAVGVPEPIFLVAPTGHVAAVTREVQVPASLDEVLGALFDGPTSAESTAGLQSFLSGTSTGIKATVVNGVATIDFHTNPIQVVGPDQTLAIAQVVYTATQQPGVTGVSFEIAGQGIQVPTASGVQVSRPVGRADYVPQAPLP
jgi:hypothetical protein